MSTTFADDPVSPARSQFGLAAFDTPHGHLTEHRPFGLTLVRESTSAPIDMTDVTYDPQAQTAKGKDGGARPQTQQQINTPSQTTYDHTRSQDNNADTRQD